MSKEFKINRKNLSEIKRFKEQVKELKAEAPILSSKEQAPTKAQPAPAAEAAAAPAAAGKAKKKRVAGGTAEGNAIRYKKGGSGRYRIQAPVRVVLQKGIWRERRPIQANTGTLQR